MPPELAHDPAATLDRLPVSVFRLDRDGRVRFANRTVCDRLGVAAEAVVGRTCAELGMPAATVPAWQAALDDTFARGAAGQFEYLCTHPHERLVEFRFAPEFGPGGAVASVLVAMVTIDEVRRLRAALRESEELLRAFLDRAPAIAWLRDAAGRYAFVNATYLAHYNLRPEDRLGKTPEEVWPPEVAAQFVANDAKVIAGGVAQRFVEVAPESAAGAREWLNVKFPFVAADGTTLVGGIGVDVTEQRAADARVAVAARLESLGLLAAGAAHDFNNLLAAIVGHAELARMALPPDAPAAAHLGDIQAAGARAAELCRQMLAFAGRAPGTPGAVDLAELVRDTARLARPALGRAADVRLDLPADPLLVRADPTNLRQVVLNLLTNASDAMADRPGAVTVAVAPAAGRAVLSVADQGCGIPPEVQARIFEPFFTTKGGGRGTGLGLAVVHGVVRGMGGDVEVESRVGVGTTFRVRLPLA